MPWPLDELVKEWPMIKQAPLSFAIVCVLALLLAFLFSKYLYQERLKHKDDLLGSLQKKLDLQPLVPVIQGCSDERLHNLAQEDRRRLSDLIRVEKYHMGNSGLNVPEEPFLNIGFDIFNGAVYDISVDRHVEGYIALGLRRIRGEIEMRGESVQNLRHGEVGHIGLRQNLTKEDVDLITSRNNPGVDDFVFDHLVVTINGGDDYRDVAPKLLVFCKPLIR